MAVIVYLVGLVVGTAGVVHQHHVVGEQLRVSVLLEEGHGRVVFGLHGIALGVAAHVVELRRRNAQVERQHAVDGAQHTGLLLHESLVPLALSPHFAEPQGVFFELQADEFGHLRGVVAAVRLGHGFLGHEAVFAHDVGHSGEGAPVAQGVFEEPLHGLVLHPAAARVDDALQEEVGFLQLVPEEGVYLRELEGAESVPGQGLGAHHVQPREEPAAPGGLLVGDALGVDADGEVRVHLLQVVLVQGEGADAVVAYGVAQSPVGGRALVALADLFQHVGRDAAFFQVLRLGGQSRGQEDEGDELSFHIVYKKCYVFSRFAFWHAKIRIICKIRKRETHDRLAKIKISHPSSRIY